MMSTTTIVVPCYNESRRFQSERFLRFADAQRSIRFLLVNDGSLDQTGEMLGTLAKRAPRHFQFLDLPVNCGKAEAVRLGCLAALQLDPSYVGYWDADLATPLDAIPLFCSVLDRRQDIDLVLGARLPLLGRHIRRAPSRQILGKIFARLASWVLGYPICDSQCGAKLFRASEPMRSALADPFLSRWIFDVEILARMRQRSSDSRPAAMRERIYEFPLESWEEVSGSKLTKSACLKAAWELTKIYARYTGPRDDRLPVPLHPVAAPPARRAA